MEWRSVQDEFPSATTSGGQSEGSCSCFCLRVALVCEVHALKDAPELHVRQLIKQYGVSYVRLEDREYRKTGAKFVNAKHVRLAVLPKDDSLRMLLWRFGAIRTCGA
jgi:hypothetical protein